MKNKAILKSTQGCHGYGITQISQWWQEQEKEELKLTHIEKKMIKKLNRNLIMEEWTIGSTELN